MSGACHKGETDHRSGIGEGVGVPKNPESKMTCSPEMTPLKTTNLGGMAKRGGIWGLALLKVTLPPSPHRRGTGYAPLRSAAATIAFAASPSVTRSLSQGAEGRTPARAIEIRCAAMLHRFPSLPSKRRKICWGTTKVWLSSQFWNIRGNRFSNGNFEVGKVLRKAPPLDNAPYCC